MAKTIVERAAQLVRDLKELGVIVEGDFIEFEPTDEIGAWGLSIQLIPEIDNRKLTIQKIRVAIREEFKRNEIVYYKDDEIMAILQRDFENS